MSDVTRRYVVNILLQPLHALDADSCMAMLVNTEFLEKVNNVSIAQVIICTLTNTLASYGGQLKLRLAYGRNCIQAECHECSYSHNRNWQKLLNDISFGAETITKIKFQSDSTLDSMFISKPLTTLLQPSVHEVSNFI